MFSSSYDHGCYSPFSDSGAVKTPFLDHIANLQEGDQELRIEKSNSLDISSNSLGIKTVQSKIGNYWNSTLHTRAETAAMIRQEFCNKYGPEAKSKFDKVFGGDFCFFYRPPLTKSKLEQLIKEVETPSTKKNIQVSSVSNALKPLENNVLTFTKYDGAPSLKKRSIFVKFNEGFAGHQEFLGNISQKQIVDWIKKSFDETLEQHEMKVSHWTEALNELEDAGILSEAIVKAVRRDLKMDEKISIV